MPRRGGDCGFSRDTPVHRTSQEGAERQGSECMIPRSRPSREKKTIGRPAQQESYGKGCALWPLGHCSDVGPLCVGRDELAGVSAFSAPAASQAASPPQARPPAINHVHDGHISGLVCWPGSRHWAGATAAGSPVAERRTWRIAAVIAASERVPWPRGHRHRPAFPSGHGIALQRLGGQLPCPGRSQPDWREQISSPAGQLG